MIVLLGESSHSASIGPPSRNVFSPACPLSGPLKTQILVKFSQCGRTHRCEQDGVSGAKIGGSGAKIGASDVKTGAVVFPAQNFPCRRIICCEHDRGSGAKIGGSGAKIGARLGKMQSWVLMMQ